MVRHVKPIPTPPNPGRGAPPRVCGYGLPGKGEPPERHRENRRKMATIIGCGSTRTDGARGKSVAYVDSYRRRMKRSRGEPLYKSAGTPTDQ